MVKAEDMMAAYFDCHKHKASSPDAIRFDINLFENITDLAEQVNSRTYEPLPSITFVVSRPPYKEKLMMAYVNEKTCNCLRGQLVLPSTPVISGYGSYCCNGTAPSTPTTGA